MRSGPSTNNEVIGKVSIGMKVTQIDYSNDWYKVEIPNKSSGWIYKTLVKIEKQNKVIVPQKTDTIQLKANATANTIRAAFLNLYKKRSLSSLDLLITQEYPLKINLAHELNGTYEVSGIYDGISISGKIKLFIEGNEMITMDGNFSHISSGKYICEGHFKTKGFPLYFENGEIIFTDNVKSCTFSEGCTFIVNNVSYVFTNGKWEE